MFETANLALPMVQSSQAQKHVTVNEALARLDAAAQLTLVSRWVDAPPASPADGTAYIVPTTATGDWVGQAGRIAVFSNGGWVFVAPKAGWRGWLSDTGRATVFDGVEWSDGAVALSPAGAASVLEVVERDIVLTPGASVVTGDVIPASAVVFGITGIVVDAITGAATAWRLGVPGAEDRYGSGIGTPAGAWLQGVTGQPLAYYAPTPLVVTAEGGDFAGGVVRLAVHLYRMRLPRV